MKSFLSPNPSILKKRRHDLPFLWAGTAMDKEQLKNISLLYAFYAHVKELAAIPNKTQAKAYLGELEQELDAPSCAYMVRLCEVMDRLGIDKLYAKELISAARFQAAKIPVAHHNQLVIYCYKNLGSLALMALPAFGVKNPGARSFALDLGIGANLVRVCSEVLQDAQKGFIFLPKRDLNQLKLRESELARAGDAPVELKKLARKYLRLADCYLDSSMGGLPYLPLKTRFGVLLAIRSCKETAAKVRRMDCEILEERPIRLNPLEKFAAGVKAGADVLRPGFWSLGKRRPFLHASLAGLPGVEGAGGR